MNRKEVDSYKDIKAGCPADQVLQYMGKHKMIMKPKVLGRNKDGLVVEWHYRDVIFTLAMGEAKFTEDVTMRAYAVQKIELRSDDGDK
jgi:hypothetical protein